MTNEDVYLHMYTMTADSGFAPYVTKDWISLACCAGPVRKDTKIGYFVLGVAGKTMKGVKQHTPIFLMKVDEKLTFDEYYKDLRFIGRADNIYRKKGEEYIQDRRYVKDKRYIKEHEGENDARKSEYVLLSRNFYYFGDYWKKNEDIYKFTKAFCSKIGFRHTGGGQYKKLSINKKYVRDFLDYIKKNFDTGVIGNPNIKKM